MLYYLKFNSNWASCFFTYQIWSPLNLITHLQMDHNNISVKD